MTWANYDDVLGQLRSAGLVVERLEVGYNPRGKPWRCKIEGDREQRGWYILHELRLDSGDLVLVGSFGIYRGAEPNAQKVELKLTKLSADQRTALRARIADDRKRAEAARQRSAERAAERARRGWEKCTPEPPAGVPNAAAYLERKLVQGHGVRYSPRGAVVVPMLDVHGRVHGLQFIHSKKRNDRDKDFWPPGLAKTGHFFMLGPVPFSVLLIAEGYATAASLFEATGYPVAVAFDAGNLQPVATALHERYKRARVLIAADDDYLTDGNPGCTKAAAAALAVEGAWLAPTFAADRAGRKITDFNDLHALEGLHAVRSQVEAKLRQQQWLDAPCFEHTQGEGGAADDADKLAAINHPDELHERFAIVYGMGGFCFDEREHELVPLSDVRNICAGSWISREWLGSHTKRIVRKREVDFDPAGTDPAVRCNLWGGWPTTPKEGECEMLLELGEYLCRDTPNAAEAYQYMMDWLAYPMQHPGAKMRSALVFHGPQGTGKNMFFESIMAIYGTYGRIIDQAAVEDKFNDWASRKLFLIADEVVARMELYHTKNKLKSLITGEWVRINPKNLGAHDERNHVNMVFLSNETQPLVLERDDRRYFVIWTPPKQDMAFYERVRIEIQAGGVAALHHHLLQRDLRNFKPWSLPPMTEAKADLIEYSLDSTERFWREWVDRSIPLPLCAVRSEDLYEGYRHWCHRNGVSKAAQLSTFAGNCGKRPGAVKRVRRYYPASGGVAAQAMFIMPPGKDGGGDTIQTLSDGVQEFRLAVKDWRDDKDYIRGVA